MATYVRYTELVLSVFNQGYLLILLGLSSSYLSTGDGTDEDAVAVGEVR